MTIATFKDICIDSNDPSRAGPFWSTVLGLDWHVQEGGDGWLTGPTPQHTIWVNRVPELKTVKNRVHLDVYAESLADLEALGCKKLWDGPKWTTMADPEGAEFCAFLRETLPPQRLHGLVVDCADPDVVARWWGRVFGQPVVEYEGFPWLTVDGPSGAPFTMDFVPVPEPKTVKNRVHWDVTGDDVMLLLDAGATLLRSPDSEISWHILADPEGNEFCLFPPKQ